MPTWRYLIQRTLIPPLVRLNLFAFGFHYITITGKQASRSEAPVLVANHQSFLDIWLWLWQLLPVGVSAAENMRFPVMGSIMLAFQTIFVERETSASGKGAAAQLAATVADPRYPQVLTYPEGNTGNGSCLCGFKLGAFQLGVPVQPVVVKYNNHKLHPAWVEPLGIPLPTLVLRLMLQLWNTMEVHYMDPVAPGASEEPQAFMERVQRLMADRMAVPITQYSFGDTALMFRAKKYKMDPSQVLMEMDRTVKVFGLGVTECKECLEYFAKGLDVEHPVSFDETKQKGRSRPKRNGATLTGKGLSVALGLSQTTNSELEANLLSTFDQSKSGDVTFREFVAGLAPPAKQFSSNGDEKLSFYKRAASFVADKCT